METKDWITLVASVGALIFSTLNFRRNKSIENQNHVFKLKIEIYSTIFKNLNSLINAHQDSIVFVKANLQNLSDKKIELIDQKANEIDELCFKFDDMLISNSLIIPTYISTHLHKLSSMILDQDPINTEDISTISNTIDTMEKFLDHLISEANLVGNILKKDLRADEVNFDLFNRLGKQSWFFKRS